MKAFVKELIKLTGVSKTLAIAAWYTLDDHSRTKPALAAYDYAKKYNMILKLN